jgi:hypothetical protein
VRQQVKTGKRERQNFCHVEKVNKLKLATNAFSRKNTLERSGRIQQLFTQSRQIGKMEANNNIPYERFRDQAKHFDRTNKELNETMSFMKQPYSRNPNPEMVTELGVEIVKQGIAKLRKHYEKCEELYDEFCQQHDISGGQKQEGVYAQRKEDLLMILDRCCTCGHA